MRYAVLLSLAVGLGVQGLFTPEPPSSRDPNSPRVRAKSVISWDRAPAQEADTLEGIQQVRHILRDHYGGLGRAYGASQDRLTGEVGVLSDRDQSCDGGDGDICHGGDPDNGSCRAGASCHPTAEFLVDVLHEAATEYPTSGFILGQAVYALTKFHQPTRAMLLLNQCQAQPWWCKTLEGYVLHSLGRFPEAETSFRAPGPMGPAVERS
jgi:hypothetical protein